MKKKKTSILNECYFSAAITLLIKQGNSVYEIADELKAHTNLIERFVFAQDQQEQLKKNTFEFLEEVRLIKDNDDEFFKYRLKYGVVYYEKKDCFFCCLNYPKTLTYWLKKTNDGQDVYDKILLLEAINESDEVAVKLSLKKMFAMIYCHLNGMSNHMILKKYDCSHETFWKLQKEVNMPAVLTEAVMQQQVKNILRAGGDIAFVKQEIAGIPENEINRLSAIVACEKKFEQDAADRIELVFLYSRLNGRGKRLKKNKFLLRRNGKGVVCSAKFSGACYSVAKKLGVSEQVLSAALPALIARFNSMCYPEQYKKPAAILPAQKNMLLQQKICAKNFSLGLEVKEIANRMNLKHETVVAMLQKEKMVA